MVVSLQRLLFWTACSEMMTCYTWLHQTHCNCHGLPISITCAKLFVEAASCMFYKVRLQDFRSQNIENQKLRKQNIFDLVNLRQFLTRQT